jgi:uncharacterized protein (TIGR02246 family)
MQMIKAHQAITEAYQAFQKAFHTGDADTIALMYTEDAELFVPETSTIKGREAIAQAWKAIVGSGGNSVRVEIGEVQESGDWAYEIGRFTASAPDGIVLNAGKYIVIWKRQATGEWKTHRDIFHWDIPPGKPSLS